MNKLILDRGSCENLHKKFRFADPVFITSGIYIFVTHPLIFEWFYWLPYVTWYKFSGQLSRNNPRPSRYLSSDFSVEEKHGQQKNFNFSFVLFSMEGNQTSVMESSDGDIKTLMASAVPESTKKSLKYAVIE